MLSELFEMAVRHAAHEDMDQKQACLVSGRQVGSELIRFQGLPSLIQSLLQSLLGLIDRLACGGPLLGAKLAQLLE